MFVRLYVCTTYSTHPWILEGCGLDFTAKLIAWQIRRKKKEEKNSIHLKPLNFPKFADNSMYTTALYPCTYITFTFTSIFSFTYLYVFKIYGTKVLCSAISLYLNILIWHTKTRTSQLTASTGQEVNKCFRPLALFALSSALLTVYLIIMWFLITSKLLQLRWWTFYSDIIISREIAYKVDVG